MSLLTAILIAALALGWIAATYRPMTPQTKLVVGFILAIIVIVWFLAMAGFIPVHAVR